MATITLTNDQLHLIQNALDLYSRIGILQFERILDHPTIDKNIIDMFTPKKDKLEVGDDTVRGKVVEIGEGYIKTNGWWSKGQEIKTWTDVDKIKLSPDWNKIHRTKDMIESHLNAVKSIVSDNKFGPNASYGIHSREVDESCREAFDMIQVIRHEFWKENPNRSNATVDSSVSKVTGTSLIKVELDNIKDIRKQKLKKLEK